MSIPKPEKLYYGDTYTISYNVLALWDSLSVSLKSRTKGNNFFVIVLNFLLRITVYLKIWLF